MKKEKLQTPPQKYETSDYYRKLYADKRDNLEERDKFLEMYSLPRLNQEEIENMNRSVTSNETKSAI